MVALIKRTKSGLCREEAEVILYEKKEEAVEKLKDIYIAEVRNFEQIDYKQTYVDEDWMYGQVVFGPFQVKIQITDGVTIV